VPDHLPNISRRPIVDEAALIDALHRRSIAGAGLDTFDIGPLPPDHPFLTLPNTLVTPHIGYVTEEAYQAFYSCVIKDIRVYIKPGSSWENPYIESFNGKLREKGVFEPACFYQRP